MPRGNDTDSRHRVIRNCAERYKSADIIPYCLGVKTVCMGWDDGCTGSGGAGEGTPDAAEVRATRLDEIIAQLATREAFFSIT